MNPKTSHSQEIGGVVWGIGMALHEATEVDHRYGRIMNPNLQHYHVPVSADIGEIETIFVEEDDKIVNPLGIKVTNIEPSGFRTEWAGASATYVDTQIEDYRPTVGENLKGIQGYSGRQPGDPVRAAQAMYDVVQQENPPLHLPLGKAAVKGAREKFEGLLQELSQVAAIGDAADYPAGE